MLFPTVLTESRVRDMLPLLMASIAAITLHTSRAALNTYQQFSIAAEAPGDYFFAQSNTGCLATCDNGYSYSPPKNKLALCWTTAIYRSRDSKCWCHNDTADFLLSASSSQPSSVLMRPETMTVRKAVLIA